MKCIDHLVYATPDLEAAIDDLEQRLGGRATLGGQHPAFGTKNALLALGPDVYLEIIGPSAASDKPTIFGINTLSAPRLVTWVAKSDNLKRDTQAAKACGVDLGKISAGQRRQTDGSLLSWQLSDPYTRPEDGIIPFLIDWGNSPHPANHIAQGCSLIELRMEHSESERIQLLFTCLGIGLSISAGPTPRLIAKLDTPKGIVEL